MDESEQWAKEKVFAEGSSVVQVAWIRGHALEWAKLYNTTWYRSKDSAEPDRLVFGSFLLNKKWIFEEEFNKHMMILQQVTVQ